MKKKAQSVMVHVAKLPIVVEVRQSRLKSDGVLVFVKTGRRRPALRKKR